MREIDRLSARFVATVTERGYHADGNGLYLVVDDTKRWAFIFQWRGRRAEMGLGPLRDVSLKDARLARDAARKLVRAGVNPIDERRRAHSLTFGEIATAHIAAQSASWSPKTAASWTSTLEGHAAKLWKKAPGDIDTADVLEVIKPVWLATPEVGGKLRGRIETILDVAKAKGMRQGENPARWKGHLSLMLPARPKLVRGHFAALPYREIKAFMADLGEAGGMGARALQATILSALRTTESIGGRGEEVDLETMVWTVPKERMKRIRGKPRREHRVPISGALLRVLEPIEPGFLFPGLKPKTHISSGTMDAVLKRMGREDITVHGFRSTFRDWAAEETQFPSDIVEQCLAHQVGSDVERAYRRGDVLERRREVMEAWATYCGL